MCWVSRSLTVIGLLTLLVFAAVLYDILTDGEKKMWREARHGTQGRSCPLMV